MNKPAAVLLRRAPAACDYAAALSAARLDVPLDALALPSARHRTNLRGRVKRIADCERAREAAENLEDLVIARARGKHPRADVARLAVVQHRRAEQGLGGPDEVGVVEDDRGGLAAELEGHGPK